MENHGSVNVRVRLSELSRDKFLAVADKRDMPYALIIRLLVCYALRKGEQLFVSFKKYVKTFTEYAEDGKIVVLGTKMKADLLRDFQKMSKHCGWKHGIFLKKLIMLYTEGYINHNDLIELMSNV